MGSSSLTQYVEVAGEIVQVNFAHSGLCEQLYPAMEHLAIEPSAHAGLNIHVWDSAASGFSLPPPETAQALHYMASGERWGSNLRRGEPDEIRLFYMPPPNEYFSGFDPVSNTAVYWVPDAIRIPYYERGSPMRTIFDWWLESRGMLLTHAAAVGNNNGGALIVGKGGRGKSTSAISSLFSEGLNYLSDDYLVLRSSPRPEAFSIYSTGKLDADHLKERLPQLHPLLDNAPFIPEEKGLFFFYRHFPNKLSSRLALKVALLPTVTDAKVTRVVQTSPGRLLIGLAASTIYQSTGAGGNGLKILRETLDSLPCYLLEAGTDLQNIAPCIKAVINRHASD